jgi:hypothetical protein
MVNDFIPAKKSCAFAAANFYRLFISINGALKGAGGALNRLQFRRSLCNRVLTAGDKI